MLSSMAFSLLKAVPKYFMDMFGKKKNSTTNTNVARMITVKVPFRRLRFFLDMSTPNSIITHFL